MMRHAIALTLVSLAAAPAAAAVQTYTATLTGAAERPAPVASPGSGTATVVVDDVANTLFVTASFTGLLGETTMAHIHCCAGPNATAGVATPVPNFPGFPLGVTAGSYSRSFDLLDPASYNPAFITANGGSAASARTALLTGLNGGLAYFNVHTGRFPGGEIRGQLTAVPEPASWALMIGGLGLVGAAIRRRRLSVGCA